MAALDAPTARVAFPDVDIELGRVGLGLSCLTLIDSGVSRSLVQQLLLSGAAVEV